MRGAQNGSVATSRIHLYQVVGITMQTYTGDMGGLLGATRACLSAYGAGARMCNTLAGGEVRNSTNLPPTGPNPPPSPLYLTSCLLPDAKKAVEFPIRHAIG